MLVVRVMIRFAGLTGLSQLLAQRQQAFGQGALLNPACFKSKLLAFGFDQARLQRQQLLEINQQTGFGVTAHGLALAPAFGQFTAQLLKLAARRPS